ncbi:MAG: response regulator [Myxococcales bacterium]|nr:response regulator [Myxococcales bacterium]
MNVDPTELAALERYQAELEVQNHELREVNAELQQANLALRAARDRYQALHDLAPVPLVTIDATGVLRDVNRAACELLRAPREHLIERRLLVFVPEARRPALNELISSLFASPAAQACETELEFDEGVPAVEILLDGAAIEDEGRAVAVLALVDVTTKKVNERRSHEALRLESLGTLAGGIAHTFNNLLTVVLGGTDHVLDELGRSSKLAEPLLDVHRAARQAGELAHQMLAYSGHGSEPAHNLQLARMIENLEPMLRTSAPGVPLELHLDSSVPPILADELQLRQVVINLVVNAAEAMRDRAGSISITVREIELTPTDLERTPELRELVTRRNVVLEVRDEGTGMTAATAARAFDPYFSTRRLGRGLGLSVVRGIVRGHRGVVAIETQLDHGTTFRIYLPAALPAEIAPAPSLPPSVKPLLVGRVLVVDDDPQVVRIVERVIRRLGLTVVSARGGAEAIELVQREGSALDLVLMDLSMPEVSGLAAGTAIRALYPALPIVLITGFGEIPPEAGSVFTSMLAKPFDATALGAAVRRFLQKA